MPEVKEGLTAQELKRWEELKRTANLIFNERERVLICKTYSKLFNKPYRDDRNYKRLIKYVEKIEKQLNNN